MPDAFKRTLGFDCSQALPRAALACLPAVALPLVVGVALHRPTQAVLVTGGAFTVGFGSFQSIGRSRLLPMALAAAGVYVSSWLGALAGSSESSVLALAFVAGLIYGELRGRGPAVAWISLQCVIWAVISTAYPAHGLAALVRGLYVLGGGVLQIASISVTRLIARAPPPAPAASGANDRRPLLAAFVLTAAALLDIRLGLSKSYWIPMTAAIVMQTGARETAERALARTLGTLVGAAMATVIASELRPGQPIVVALVLTFAAGAYLLLKVNYAAFVACLTAYLVFLLALAGLPERPVVWRRLVDTLLGAAVTIAVHLAAAPTVRKRRDRAALPQSGSRSPVR